MRYETLLPCPHIKTENCSGVVGGGCWAEFVLFECCAGLAVEEGAFGARPDCTDVKQQSGGQSFLTLTASPQEAEFPHNTCILTKFNWRFPTVPFHRRVILLAYKYCVCPSLQHPDEKSQLLSALLCPN